MIKKILNTSKWLLAWMLALFPIMIVLCLFFYWIFNT